MAVDQETAADSNNDQFHPWKLIWTKPRQAIEQVVQVNPNRYVLLIAAIVGMERFLAFVRRQRVVENGDMLVYGISAISLGTILGIALLYLTAYLVAFTGRWFGGVGERRNIRAALAWASFPQVLLLVLWLGCIVFAGDKFFNSRHLPDAGYPLIARLIFYSLHFGRGPVLLWTFVLAVLFVAYTQQLSVFKSLCNLLSAFLLIALPLGTLMLVISFIN